jgi:hypothetical protein
LSWHAAVPNVVEPAVDHVVCGVTLLQVRADRVHYENNDIAARLAGVGGTGEREDAVVNLRRRGRRSARGGRWSIVDSATLGRFPSSCSLRQRSGMSPEALSRRRSR